MVQQLSPILSNYLQKKGCKQASAYEACDRRRTPLHIPKTLEMCKKNMSCLIKKASRCAADRTAKTTTFFIFHFYKTQ